MPKLAALFSPERAADVVDAATRRLLEDRFEVVWATAEHTAGPGSAAKPPALDPAAVPELVNGADVLLTSWGTPHLGKELWSDGNGPKVVAHAAGTVKNLIDPAILDQGVAVFSAGPRIAWSVGEYCLASMLTLARRLPRFDGAVRAGAGSRRSTAVTNWPARRSESSARAAPRERSSRCSSRSAATWSSTTRI